MSYPRTRHPRRAGALLAAALLLTVTACTGDAHQPDTTPVAAQISGPLCAALPAGDEPGNPTYLAGQPVATALQWMPTLTTFEAALRTSGLLPDLERDGITLLAPSDDAFATKFSDDTWDALMTKDQDKLRTLVKAHLIAGTHTLDELADDGTATTLDGATLTVTRTGDTARFGNKADAVCGDYQATRARIHIINTVLGPLPTDAGGRDHRG